MTTLFQLLGEPESTPDFGHPVQERTLVEDASRHGLAGVVRHLLAERRVSLNAASREELSRHERAVGVGTLRTKRLLLSVLDALAARQIVPVLLKGYGLGARLYSEPLLRPTSDVDVLIPESQMEAAAQAMERLGLSAMPADEAADARAHHHSLNYTGQQGMVELHFRALAGFGTILESGSLLEQTVEAELEQRRVRYLQPADELVYLAAHAAQHLFLRLAWLYDLKLFLDKHPALNVERAVALARAYHLEGPVYVALELARVRLNATVPPALLEGLRPTFWQRVLPNLVFTEERLASASLAEFRGLPSFVRLFFIADANQAILYLRHTVIPSLRRKIQQIRTGSAWV